MGEETHDLSSFGSWFAWGSRSIPRLDRGIRGQLEAGAPRLLIPGATATGGQSDHTIAGDHPDQTRAQVAVLWCRAAVVDERGKRSAQLWAGD